MQNEQRWGFGLSTWNNIFHDREIYVRTAGHVRFLHIGATFQRRVATLVLAAIAIWLLVTMGLLAWQAWTSWKTRDVDARAVAVEQAEAMVAAERQSIEGIANSLNSRQDSIEALFKSHFGEELPQAGAKKAAEAAAVPNAAQPAAAVVPVAATAAAVSSPETAEVAAPGRSEDIVGRLATIRERQDQLLLSLTDVAESRIERAEMALKSVGLRPRADSAMGGPFIPFGKREAPLPADPMIRRLSSSLDRMARLENLLMSLPSGLPTHRMELSSGFGYRRDPFNTHRAMHNGLDFRGAHGTPILSAAPGRIKFAGVKGGYGNVIEVDHGHGIMTRYAHLSGFNVRMGQKVKSGEQIGRMGSTGRSTGTHLHFEIHVNNVAVNPRRFLEANPHVLEVKADVRSKPGAYVGAV